MRKLIAVIEDNSADIFLLEQALEEAELNYELHSLEDGEQARNYVIGSREQEPDLILVDMNLPRLTGIEILKLIRQQPSLQSVPVVVWSSAQSPRDRAAVEEFGIARYIPKPSALEDFLEIGRQVRQVLEERSMAGAPA